MHALLISTYELGRQPFGLASPAAWLRRAGCLVTCVDVSKDRLSDEMIASADLIGFHLPMHTATRLAVPVIQRARRRNPSARICAYGLYAPLNEEWLRALGVDAVFGGEFEEELTGYACDRSAALQACRPGLPKADLPPSRLRFPPPPRLRRGHAEVRQESGRTKADGDPGRSSLTPLASEGRKVRTTPRLKFVVPDRSGLPALDRYATLQLGDGRRKLVGYTEASRGCRHLCRHCPVVPIYQGQFRVVQPEVVLADIDAQIRAGAEHMTFGDPDFFNGPTHAMRIVERLHEAHPAITYDVTIKVEHLLQHRRLLDRLRDTGCLFVTSAVESVDDEVLARLEKGHTRHDFIEAVAACRDAGVTMVPTFVAFHPWLTPDGYCDLLDTIETLDLVEHVAPIQLAIRLLIPKGSRLLELEQVRGLVSEFDPATLTYRWAHRDRRVDDLHSEISKIVGARLVSDRSALFNKISALAHERAGRQRISSKPVRDRATVPYLNEPWYC